MTDGAIPDLSTLAGTDVAHELASLQRGEPWFECQIAGLQYHSYDVVDEMTGTRIRPEPGDRLSLVREPTNQYDRNAIEVVWRNSHRLGHLPRPVAAEIAPLLDAGSPARAYAISGGTGRAWSVRVLVIGAAGAVFHQKHLARVQAAGAAEKVTPMPKRSPSFVDGLVELDLQGTRKRLAAVMAESRTQADWTAGPPGDAIAEALRHVDAVLLESARWAVQRLDTALAEARSAPPHRIVATREKTLAEHHAAVVAALDSDEPWPLPPRTRPPLPSLRTALLMIPKRSAASA